MPNNNPTGINQYTKGGGRGSSKGSKTAARSLTIKSTKGGASLKFGKPPKPTGGIDMEQFKKDYASMPRTKLRMVHRLKTK